MLSEMEKVPWEAKALIVSRQLHPTKCHIEWISKDSDLHYVLAAISDFPVSRVAHIRFRDHIRVVLELWKALPNSLVQACLEERKQEASAKKANMLKKAAERERLRQQVAVELEKQRRHTLSPPMPAEILAKIFEDGLTQYSEIDTDFDERHVSEYDADRLLLYNCCLVARQWSICASQMLYLGRVHLCESQASTHRFTLLILYTL